MFCDKCGAIVESDSKFCDSCGKAIELPVTGGQPTTASELIEHSGHRWGKPLLVIALTAVAATAAVIVYEKVDGSWTERPGSNTVQRPTNPIVKAINSVLGTGALTRSEAKTLIEKNIALPDPIQFQVWTYPYEQTHTWMDPPLGHLQDIPIMQEAIRKGYVVQEPGQKFIGGVINADNNYGYVPSFSNKLTEQGRKIMPEGRIIIVFSKTVEVTGITEDGETATYTVTFTPVLPVGDAQLNNMLLGAYQWQHGYSGRAYFQKFDDGWRVR